MTNETEIWFIPRILQIEYIDNRILTTRYRIAYDTAQRSKSQAVAILGLTFRCILSRWYVGYCIYKT